MLLSFLRGRRINAERNHLYLFRRNSDVPEEGIADGKVDKPAGSDSKLIEI